MITGGIAINFMTEYRQRLDRVSPIFFALLHERSTIGSEVDISEEEDEL